MGGINRLLALCKDVWYCVYMAQRLDKTTIMFEEFGTATDNVDCMHVNALCTIKRTGGGESFESQRSEF
jgi:hypothetical protein